MKISKLLIVTLLCVGLASAADARQKRHRGAGHHKNHKNKGKHHQVVSQPTPTPAPVPPSDPAPATHHTITPSVASTNSPGVWTYDAMLSSGQVMNGDGFTIFDFGGYVAGSILAPTGWSATVALTGSVLGIPAPVSNPDNPALFNLLFTRTGGTVGPTNGMLLLGQFQATTTDTSTTFVGWSSRDHLPTGGIGNPHQDIILAPAPGDHVVPDGGATVALLGIALAGLEGMRRVIRARKA
jgi:protein with PEP-CTERM/exosortase system signal